ncbi:HEPN/Toprim-associated domain-containing protein [Cupriavidus taiwanensis]
MKARLDALGYTVEDAEREFKFACDKLSDEAGQWHDWIENEDVELYDRMDLKEWLEAARFVISAPKKAHVGVINEVEGSAIHRLLLKIDDHLRRSTWLPLDLGIPARSINGAMRIALEAAPENASCELDATELVRGGYIADFFGKENAASAPRTTVFHDTFVRSTTEALQLFGTVPRGNDVLCKMVYSNLVTALEAYLSDTARRFILKDRNLLRRYVESGGLGQREKKVAIQDLFTTLDQIQSMVQESLERVSFHNIGDIKSIFNNVLLADIPEALLDDLAGVVSARHDLVHRNGNAVDGSPRKIELHHVNHLHHLLLKIVQHVDNFVISNLLPKLNDIR